MLQRATDKTGPGRVYTFKLDGKAEAPEFVQYDAKTLVAGVPYSPDDVGPGAALYVANCLFCHGVPGVNNGGNVKNLGYSDAATLTNAASIVLTSALEERGMPNFEGKLSQAELTKIVAFIQGTADAVRPK